MSFCTDKILAAGSAHWSFYCICSVEIGTFLGKPEKKSLNCQLLKWALFLVGEDSKKGSCIYIYIYTILFRCFRWFFVEI